MTTSVRKNKRITVAQLRSLLAVAKHLSLRQASKELHLTQPAISKQLATLQRELNTRLYNRSGRGVELTEAGRLALSKLDPIVKQLDAFEALFRSNDPFPTKPRRLAVAATFSLVTEIMPALIARFEKANPGIEWQCETGSSEVVQRMVREGRVELALSTYRQLTDDLIAEPFRVQKLVFFVHPRHPLAARRRVTLLDVLAHPLVVRSVKDGPTMTHDILQELSQSGLKHKIALRCSGPLVIMQAVSKNMGVGLTHLDNLQMAANRNRFVVLNGVDFRFTTLSYIIFSAKRELSPLAQSFLEMLRRARRIPKGKELEEIEQAMNGRVRNLITKTQTPSVGSSQLLRR